MKTFTVAFTFIFTLFLVSVTDAYVVKRSSNGLFSNQLYEYLLTIKQERLITQRRKELEEQLVKYVNEKSSNDLDDADYERSPIRRKVVGLGDNPFK
ncbi:hypothetical protein I4U23_009974 [Adineta vaga]|nr:hypothetical protein I4U23_009974 [Adineta vaga]